MKKSVKILLFFLVPVLAGAQQHLPDTIVHAVKTASNDSLRYKANHDAYLYFEEINKDSALYYNEQSLSLSENDKKSLVTARCLGSKGYLLTGKGQYAEALKNLLQAFAIAEDPKNASNDWFTDTQWDAGRRRSPEQTRLFVLALIHHMYGILMRSTHNPQQEIFHFAEARRIAVLINNKPRIMLADQNLGGAYLLVNKIDSALIFLNEAKQMTLRFGPKKYLGFILTSLGDIARKKDDVVSEKHYYYEGVSSSAEQKNQTTLTWLYLRLTDLYVREKQKDSSLYFAKKAFQSFSTLGISSGETINTGTAYQKLYDSYALRGQTDSAYKYAGLALAAKDKVNNIQIENLAQFQSLSLKEQLRLQNLEKEKALYQSQVRTYASLAGLGVILMVAVILYRNNRQKHKANVVLEGTLSELRSAQNQLIQSAKMASLGELTAGIAHEIQNPLNFVNNFSEVSAEMTDELTEELHKGNITEATALAGDIKQNLEKIRHHGQRADNIVKGMLQHSRVSTGQTEPTDVNALTDEYLRLAYHGLRAKDKDFNAELVTHFDEKLPKVNIIPQDIGRVFLNVINNAFYATQQKVKTAGPDYKPAVEIRTAQQNSSVIISMKDNGNGIPDSIKDKIMQPFFTTKPTGEGTGLGLSLSYDIVVKGHGGTILANSTEGEGSEFIIRLPIN
ncbi:MAG TPA: ATP-binding protein [Mucilaginibacter sp.]|jgi:signal transduction histidine kinase|nr:ATP-binding protein [Mucilaginibacter sp.]